MTGITDIGADAAQESSANQSDGDSQTEFERFDLNGVSFGKQHPTTAVRGEAVALRDMYDENDPARSDVAVILDDPSVVTSEDSLAGSVVVQSEEEGDQFKVVNTGDDQTKVLDGMGIDFAGNTFYGDVENNFGDMDRIALKRGGGAGRRITKTLDVAGARVAESAVERDEDGELTGMTLDDEEGFPAHNGGLIEYDNEGDELPRRARAPELRPNVEGNEIVVMIQRLSEIDPDYDGPSYWATVFASLPDDEMQELAESYAETSDGKSAEDFVAELDGDEFIQLSPTDEFEPEPANIDVTGRIEFSGIDRSEASEVLALNEARLAEGHGSVYIPDGLSPDEVVPDEVDDLALDPGEDDWSDDSESVPAFGAGASDAASAQSA